MKSNEKEIWKVLIGINEKYSVSNFGRIRNNKNLFIRKLQPDKNGYLLFTFSINKKTYTKRVHQLVAIYFLYHIPNGINKVVNHIDGNVKNNNLCNLEIVTHRYNCTYCHLKNRVTFSSKYVGVYWKKDKNKWASHIRINGKYKHLGYFENEIDAYNAYLAEKTNIPLTDKNLF